jgi:F420H(2)-dependent quinone reductase
MDFPNPLGRLLGLRKIDPATVDVVMDLAREAGERMSNLAKEVSGGRIGRETVPDNQVVWVTTRRGRSGHWRTSPMLSIREGEAEEAPFIITGAQPGKGDLPKWVLNARSNPKGFLRSGELTYRVLLEEALGRDRDHLFALMTEVWQPFQTFQAQAEFDIPVFRVRITGAVAPEEVPPSA